MAGLALHRGLYHRFRLFTIYLCALAPCEIIRWVPILTTGLRSQETLWTYWITQLILILLRAGVAFEIVYYMLGPYRGVWKFCRVILILGVSFVVITALFTAESRGQYVTRTILTAERGMELAILGLILFALAFCRYYRVPVDLLSGMVALGIGLYSAVQVANNTFLNHWLARYLPYWGEIRTDSFDIVSLIWLAALWKPLPVPKKTPVLLDPDVYEVVTPQVNTRLRQLNARLEDMLK